ncbi:LLM class flavin-dependent oxidoreductase [Salsipaludibacter albus]|uniref:LLM class flavin-dependent oxidoreductase n=1 Tax=Salsipaludibacter albus TaxID=2849650 RepID=UPI001EE496AA|nr:LLM class flavin-dependent oxidoreductase [Salsipaludibacter albus]MBY5160933.1 LLM class flavin-dependent oxidoreductase [Salsipaludibacter albus]
MTTIPTLSVLDLGSVPRGATSRDALLGATRLARRADDLGYHRFWVAEHHNMPIVASTSPTTLMAHLAASTTHIRVGSGGVMLPNHPPLVVAEQVAMLEALHPGRIDLGIGRAPGTDQATAAALRRTTDALDAREFPQHLVDLLGLLGDVREGSRLHGRFSATPVATTHPPVFLLGSSGYSAQLAGMLGLAFVQAHHFDLGGTDESLRLYRQSFTPAGPLEHPHAIVSASVVVADTEERARDLSLPGRLFRLWLRSGRDVRLLSVEEAREHPDLEAALAVPTEALVGDAEQVAAGIDALVTRTGADEVMVTNTVVDYDDRITSLELLADAVGLAPPTG